MDILKEKYEEYIRTPLLKLIDEVYYYSDNVIPLHNKEKKAIGIFLKPANECSEDFINEHQAIKTYRYHLQSIGEDVACDYAIEAISEIWNKIVKYEIKKQEKRNTSNQIPQKGINLPEGLNTDEAKNCSQFLLKEILSMPNLKIILSLGAVSHQAVLRTLNYKLSAFKFAHGTVHKLNEHNLLLLDSYHTSRYNINTGVLTVPMFEKIIADVKHLLESSC